MRRMKLYYFLLLSGICTVWGQDIASFQAYKSDYPEEHLVRLIHEMTIHIEVGDEGLEIRQKNFQKDLFLDQSATYNSEHSLSYSNFYQLENLSAASIVPRGSTSVRYEVENFTHKDDLESSFYDDGKEVTFYYPNLEAGATTELEYHYNIKDPRFLGAFYVGGSIPIEEATLSIIADKGVEIGLSRMNVEGVEIIESVEEKRKYTIYNWKIRKSLKIPSEADSPNYKSLWPHLLPRIISYERNGQKVPVLGEVKDLYRWYRDMIANINPEESSQEMKDIVEELLFGIEDRDTRIQKIYQWVQDNIKYIDFEYGLGGFIPRDANDVLRKRYGDCKDNSNLLGEMLKLAGIPSYLTWIGTRDIPYRYEEVPTPMADNHMILAVPNGDSYYFLDATGRYSELERPTSFIQGKEALVGLSENEYEIIDVSEIREDVNYYRDSLYVTLEEGMLFGIGQARFDGYNKVDLFYELEGLTKEQTGDFYRSVLTKGNNTFILDTVKEEGKFSYGKPFALDYSCKIRNHIKEYGEELYLNLNLKRIFQIQKERELPRVYEYRDSYKFTFILEIPPGYEIDYIPENFTMDNDLLFCSISYLIDNNTIKYEHRAAMKKIEYTAEEYNRMTAKVREIELAYKELLVLKSNQPKS